MQVTIRFFATLRDHAGIERATLELPSPATLATVTETLLERFPALRAGLATAVVALNGEFADNDAPITDGDEVAIFPPIGGGAGDTEGHAPPTPDRINDQPTKKAGSTLFGLTCPDCEEVYPSNTERYRCKCGSAFVFAQTPPFRESAIDRSDYSVWRYRELLLPPGVTPVTLGEGWTPLLAKQFDGRTVHFKLEMLNPTGSFKDRGAAVLVSMLRQQGHKQVHDDSSGNAGTALAAYAAQAGINARLFVPASASPTKLSQIALYGAQLTPVGGPRSAASRASEQAAASGESVYASHIYNPFSILGYKSIAYELWEQLNYQAPDILIFPLGHGSQALGLSQGFEDLKDAGLIDRPPRLIGVQAAACAPLWAAFHQDEAPDKPAQEGETLAEGIRIIDPIRRAGVLTAIEASGGDILTVSENDIRQGLRFLARQGISVEPTSAVIWPAYQHIQTQLPKGAIVVLSITGSGYKTPNPPAFIND